MDGTDKIFICGPITSNASADFLAEIKKVLKDRSRGLKPALTISPQTFSLILCCRLHFLIWFNSDMDPLNDIYFSK